MGMTSAVGMARAMAEGQTSLDAGLKWHLESNHYPPVSQTWLPVCREIVRMSKVRPDLDYPVQCPTSEKLTALQVAERFHLDPFLGEVGE